MKRRFSARPPDSRGPVLAKRGEIFAVHLPNGRSTGTLNLSGVSGAFTKRWYNPRTGSFEGVTTTMTGGGNVSLGSPPSSPSEDWAVLIEKVERRGARNRQAKK